MRGPIRDFGIDDIVEATVGGTLDAAEDLLGGGDEDE
jgi:hypothetical protein